MRGGWYRAERKREGRGRKEGKEGREKNALERERDQWKRVKRVITGMAEEKGRKESLRRIGDED